MLSAQTRTLDAESAAWLRDLEREEGIERLHALLLRAARFEVGRRRGSVPQLGRAELDDIALQSADDALVAVLAKLEDFRGASRFTTWAYKFALLEAAVQMRRHAWQRRQQPLEPERLIDGALTPEQSAEQRERLDAVRRAIARDLSDRQRHALLAVVIEGMPIDVLADRLGATRGAVYKTIHDARRKLRASLRAEGHEL